MAIPTDENKIDFVNEILASVGQAPVTTLDKTNPDVAICDDTLTRVSREIQAEGWTFNKEYGITATLINNKIAIPSNYLQVDLSADEGWNGTHAIRKYDTTAKEFYLWNSTDRKWTWDTAPKLDITYEYDITQVPIPVRNYIIARSAALTSSRIVGDPQQYRLLSERELMTRGVALEYETTQGDYSFFGHPKGNHYYNSYKPYQVLNR